MKVIQPEPNLPQKHFPRVAIAMEATPYLTPKNYKAFYAMYAKHYMLKQRRPVNWIKVWEVRRNARMVQT